MYPDTQFIISSKVICSHLLVVMCVKHKSTWDGQFVVAPLFAVADVVGDRKLV